MDRQKGTIVWIFNIGAEKYWNPPQRGIVDSHEDRIVNRVEEMNLLICRKQDIVILHEMPEASFLNKLEEWGFDIPTIWVPDHKDFSTPISELIVRDEQLLHNLSALTASHEDVYLVPYAVTHLEEEIAQLCSLKIPFAPATKARMVNDKVFNRSLAKQLGLEVCQGEICTSVEEIKQQYEYLTEQVSSFDKVIIKEPNGASGKGLYIVDSESRLTALLARISRFSRNEKDSKWIVEGWYKKKADINFQLYISPSGDVQLFSIKSQVLRDTVYIGSRIPADLDEALIEQYEELGTLIGKELYKLGYYGIAGIDSIITSAGDVIPIIEINGRFTLSTYLSFLSQRFPKQVMYSRYFKVSTDALLDFDRLYDLLDQEQLMYNDEKKVGVMIYTSGTLPIQYHEASRTYTGRIFTLMIAEDWNQMNTLDNRLEEFMNRLNKVYV